MGAASARDDRFNLGRSGAPPENISILDSLLDAHGIRPHHESERGRKKDLIRELVEQVVAGDILVGHRLEAQISARIAQIDHLVSLQLNEILHDAAFHRLEATWRGLDYLVRRTGTLDGVKIRVFNATKKELLRDFHRASEFRKAALPFNILDQTLERLGAEPFSVLISDYSFAPGTDDLELLESLSKLGASAHAPILAAAAPEMFGAETYASMPRSSDLRSRFASDDYVRWRSLRCSKEAAYLTLITPPVLMRKPYPEASTSILPGRFKHQEDPTREEALLWGNPVWALTAQLAAAFARGSWCAELHAREDGGVIRKLPSFERYEDEGSISRRGPTQVAIDDLVYGELRGNGFVALCGDEHDGRAVYFETPTIYQPPNPDEYDEDEQGSPPYDQLEYVLAAARVAQYVKCIVREKRSAFTTAEECEQYLNQWAAQFTVGEGEDHPDATERRPFLEAHFRVVKNEGPLPLHWRSRRRLRSLLAGNFKVEGEVLPNLHTGRARIPLPISIGITLPQSVLATGDQPDLPIHAPHAQTRDLPTAADKGSFAAACDSLERLTELRRKEVISEPEFQQLRGPLLKAMSGVSLPASEAGKSLPSPPPHEALDMPVPYAELHSKIVDQIAMPYRSGEDAKHRAYRAMAEMAERRALNPGDSELLSQLIDVVLTPQPEEPRDNPQAHETAVSRRLTEVSDVSQAIRDRVGASPAAKAIADTAQHSAGRAGKVYLSEQASQTPNGGTLERFWRKLVWPDVEGAFSGGAAATTLFPSLTSQFPLSLPLVAAFGVVVGAGVRSGVAYGEAFEPFSRPKRAV